MMKVKKKIVCESVIVFYVTKELNKAKSLVNKLGRNWFLTKQESQDLKQIFVISKDFIFMCLQIILKTCYLTKPVTALEKYAKSFLK